MIPEGSEDALTRYKAFQSTEPELRKVYESRQKRVRTVEEEEGEDPEDPNDLAERERYIVPSTGAVLTYNTSINLLNYLCSLIPHDNYTPTPVPKYSGDFISTLELPVSLPLPNEKLVYTGPEKLSKREAKRAVAFLAVKELHALDVFDDYLLPTSTSKGKVTEDADGRALADIRKVPETMQVDVRDPWVVCPTLWLHVIIVNGRRASGLITGSVLPPVDLQWEESDIRIFGTHMVKLQYDEEHIQRRLLHDYSKLCVWYCNTGRPIEVPLSCYMVPITNANQPDWKTIDDLVCQSYGSFDWTNVGEKDYNHLLVMNINEFGRSLILREIRKDLTPLSTPPPGSRESAFPTYREYWIQKWTRKKRAAEVPTDGPLIEVVVLPRQSLGHYVREGHGPLDLKGWAQTAVDTFVVPQGCCRWVNLPEKMYRLFHLLPRILHRVTDVYRARQERFELGLPPVTDDWLVEASTLPTTDAGFNNQRLETLGDAVLKLAVTVHIFNKYPFRHEGQLSVLRQSSISNRTLLARAKEIGLEQYLTSEPQSVHVWRYTAPEGTDPYTPEMSRYVQRQFPRRSLQDCMEATLGAAFMTGGMNMALRAGDALGLSFGGQQPWSVRYSRPSNKFPTPALFLDLQESIGYEFHRGDLLVEAMTHPSFCSSENPSYQRLEFLGDGAHVVVRVGMMIDQ
jgi:endoribonuclease Dicer